ncbi:MAG: hydroxyphenylacetyl-CoA thioesterase PaaI [Gammaproteobacteria bacterium]|nr:hydroxyphenylacetyl-CoA thioesterase PaaI [Gammaproteobacteria bacterium]
MSKNDRLARLFGMQLETIEPGYSRVSMTVTADMLNAVGITHGGATYSLADFAFAVASNANGQIAVALDTTMSYTAPSHEGDILIAEAREENLTRRTGLYTVKIHTNDRLVGHFTGTVYRKEQTVTDWIEK